MLSDSKDKCNQHHLLFEKIDNQSYQAMDTWCGHKVNDILWYCSSECKEKGEEGSPLKYIQSNGPIMND